MKTILRKSSLFQKKETFIFLHFSSFFFIFLTARKLVGRIFSLNTRIYALHFSSHNTILQFISLIIQFNENLREVFRFWFFSTIAGIVLLTKRLCQSKCFSFKLSNKPLAYLAFFKTIAVISYVQ